MLTRRGGVIGLTPNRNMTKNGAATTLAEFCDMVAWTTDLIGVYAVAIGTDYCPGHSRFVRTWWRYARWSRETVPGKEMMMAPHEGWSDWKTPAGLPNIARGLADRAASAPRRSPRSGAATGLGCSPTRSIGAREASDVQRLAPAVSKPSASR